MEGDRNEDWMYTADRGELVINYVIESMKTKARIKRMEIEDYIDSDQQPLVVWIKKENGGKKRKGRRDRAVRMLCRRLRSSRHGV